jgi:hypothetical protein
MNTFNLFILSLAANIVNAASQLCDDQSCVTFSVAAGTGCAWMCNYCQNHLGTNNYYFTDGVCTYESGGCVGSPQVGVNYTCCSS